VIETRGARRSLAQLEKQQQEVRGVAKKAAMRLESDINVFENRVEVYTTAPEKVNGRVPEGVLVKRVAQHSGLDAAVGGRPMTSCTSGFAVRDVVNELGILTAGHCDDTQYYEGALLPMRSQLVGGHHDVQWHSACDLVPVTNQFESGLGLRSVTGTRGRDQQAIGTPVCKYGMATGRTCGTIGSKSFDAGEGFHSTFIRVEGISLRAPGDSGAPWFVEETAFGIHLGWPSDDANDAIYMAIDYASALGVTVLTSDPGPICNIRPFADFYSYNHGRGYYTFDASFSNDPDGYIVSYTWDWGDGTSTITTEPWAEHRFPRGTFIMEMTVTDNEGGTHKMRELIQSY
jgi:PKD domain